MRTYLRNATLKEQVYSYLDSYPVKKTEVRRDVVHRIQVKFKSLDAVTAGQMLNGWFAEATGVKPDTYDPLADMCIYAADALEITGKPSKAITLMNLNHVLRRRRDLSTELQRELAEQLKRSKS